MMRFLTIAMLFLSGCSLSQLDMEKDPFAQDLPPKIIETDLDDAEDYAKENHGIINIHRHGPGYDVMMMLNAGESDIIFSMDLPEGGETYMPEITEQMQAQNNMDGTQGKPNTIQEEKEFFNKKSLAMFSEATKHMLSAQALFYRKSYWKALEQTNRAMSLVPASAQAYALKGSIYYKMGRKRDAKKSWNNALKLDPSLTDVKESLKLVQ